MSLSDKGYLYILRNKDGLYKIGVSVDVRRRVNQLKTAQPDLELLFAIKLRDYKAAEKYLHSTLSAYRYKREWFNLRGDGKTLLECFMFLNDVYAEKRNDLLESWGYKSMDYNFTFREGTSDKNIFHDVFNRNEYKLPSLSERDIVLDVGAHIGSFSAKAYDLGSRAIVAYEPDPTNYSMAVENLKQCDDGVLVCNYAVTGDTSKKTVYHSGYTLFDHGEINTGGGNTVLVSPDSIGATEVPAVEINTVFDYLGINSYDRRLKVFKLDCEGAEWDILYNLSSTNLSSVDYICMEFHEYADHTVGKLIAHLRLYGFTVDYFRHGTSALGMLFAKNGAMKF